YRLLSDFIVTTNKKVRSVTGFVDLGDNGVGLSLFSGERVKTLLNVTGPYNGETAEFRILETNEIPLTFTESPRYKPTNQNPTAYITKNATGTAIRLRIDPTVNQTFSVSYLQNPKVLTSAQTEDIQWSENFEEAILTIAVAFSLLYDGDRQGFESLAKGVLSGFGI
ncbi:MAG: hypothetical protein KDD43_15935, partial [Bdellovibrionales bacterium]|nr:hypothetical protein [Bdellovibrionales bacterium]